MHIRNDRQLALPADCPKPPEIFAVEANNSRVEALRIEIVVQDEINDARGAGRLVVTEQKRSALAAFATATLSQLCRQPPPKEPRARKLTLRREPSADSRRN